MADSVIEALIGDAPDGVEQIKALADQLRRRQSFAELGLMSGNKTLGEFGKSVLSNDKADEIALGSRRDKHADDVRQDAQFKNLMGHQRDVLDQQMGIADMNDARMREIAELNRNARLDALAAAKGDKVDKFNEQQVTKFKDTLDKQGYSELYQSMNDLNGMLNKYTDENGKRTNIPGVGGAHNNPIVGPVADLFGSGSYQEAKDNKGIIAAVRNNILKARSGGAVTPQEADRMLEELNLGTTSGQAEFVRSMKRLSARINSRLSNVFAVGPEIRDLYSQRGGRVQPSLSPIVDAADDLPLGDGAPTSPVDRTTPTPTPGSDPTTDPVPGGSPAHTAPISGGGGAPYVRTGTRIRNGKKEKIGLLPDGTIDVIGVLP